MVVCLSYVPCYESDASATLSHEDGVSDHFGPSHLDPSQQRRIAHSRRNKEDIVAMD